MMSSVLNQTAEIIALLYEATQGPPLPIDEPPALNPTGTQFSMMIRHLAYYEIGGVKGKQPPPLNGLQYKKDPTRQGSGVFIIHDAATRKNYEDLPPGVMAPGSDSGSEGEESVVHMSSYPVANEHVLLLHSHLIYRSVFPGFYLRHWFQRVTKVNQSRMLRPQVQCLPRPWSISHPSVVTVQAGT
jgi:hypothetical protein